jgi:glutathione S-transferase
MFGLSHEICGEDGFGWNRRLMMISQVLEVPAQAESPLGEIMRRLGARYGYSRSAAAAAPERCAEILRLLASRLRRQRESGRRFFVGESLSALDVYWAVFTALASPLPAEICPMPEFLRTLYQATSPVVIAALDPILLEHRDFIYEEFLELPLDF